MKETERPIELSYIRLFLAIFGAVLLIFIIIQWLEDPFNMTISSLKYNLTLETVGNTFAFIFDPLTAGLYSILLLPNTLNMSRQLIGVFTSVFTGIVSLSVFVSVLFGLSGRKRWGWILTMSIIIVILVLDCIAFYIERYLPSLISIVIFLVVLYAMYRKNMREYFLT